MSELRIYSENNPASPAVTYDDERYIAKSLKAKGVRFERWEASQPVGNGDAPDKILAAYAKEIEALKSECGFQTADTISLTPDNPAKDELRKKFLDEHTHSEDEVRFFVDGEGLFYLHLDDGVYAIHCCKNDLISVPAGTKHWFDMGPNPNFTCIRLFTNTEGWVANFTGDNIAVNFPRFEEASV